VIKLALEQRAAVEMINPAAIRVGLEQGLKPLEKIGVEKGLLLAFEPFIAVVICSARRFSAAARYSEATLSRSTSF
jgi:hypothetical protein